MSTEKLRPSFTFTEERLAELRAVVPEAFPDGKLDWDTLREALGEQLDDADAPQEHFGLNWPGKREARRLAARPSKGTLRPAPGEGVNEETTGNLFIEGDNLEVLKLLQKSYAGRVKMIYIDPPYNTGNDFVYKDDFSEPLASYLRRSGQAGEGGELLTSNPKSSGRFHTNWLNMMYPRLRLARTLLKDDGVIFVSIDDHEIHNLRALMNEVFGEENFIGQITVLTNPKGRVLAEHLAQNHDYLLIYARNATDVELSLPKTEEQLKSQYTEKDSVGNFRSLELRNTHRQFGKHNRENLYYTLYVDTKSRRVSLGEHADAVRVLPIWDDNYKGCWTWGRDKVKKEGDFLEGRYINGRWKIFRKSYAISASGEVARKKSQTIWVDKEFHTEKGQGEVDSLLEPQIFQSPKPTGLLKAICQIGAQGNDDIVLDFFSGSGSTAHSVLQLNRMDHGTRKFIVTQIPEPTPEASTARKAGYATIAEMGKERIRRVIKQLQAAPPTLTEPRDTPEDLGFKVLKLAPSHFKAWNDYEGTDLTTLQTLFDEQETPLEPGWTPDGLLTEVLLTEGFPLDSVVEMRSDFTQNTIRCVASSAAAHRLWVCFDDAVHPVTLDALDLPPGDIFICLDAALDDNAKLRLTQAGSLKTI